MPEFKVEGGKGPVDVIRRDAGLDSGVFGHIAIIIEINKIMPQSLALDNDDRTDYKQTN